MFTTWYNILCRSRDISSRDVLMNAFYIYRNQHNRLTFDNIIFFETTLSKIYFNLLNDD